MAKFSNSMIAAAALACAPVASAVAQVPIKGNVPPPTNAAVVDLSNKFIELASHPGMFDGLPFSSTRGAPQTLHLRDTAKGVDPNCTWAFELPSFGTVKVIHFYSTEDTIAFADRNGLGNMWIVKPNALLNGATKLDRKVAQTYTLFGLKGTTDVEVVIGGDRAASYTRPAECSATNSTQGEHNNMPRQTPNYTADEEIVGSGLADGHYHVTRVDRSPYDVTSLSPAPIRPMDAINAVLNGFFDQLKNIQHRR